MFSDKAKKKYKFEGTVDKIRQLRDQVYKDIFNEVIRPVLARYNWSMDWAMGSVSFYNAKGREIMCETSGGFGVDSGKETLKSLIKEVEDIFDDLPAFGKGGTDGLSLWWIMSGMRFDGRYSIKNGFQPWEEKEKNA